MPNSISSCYGAHSRGDDNVDVNSNAGLTRQNSDMYSKPGSPATSRNLRSARPSDLDLRSRPGSRFAVDEQTSLLANQRGPPRSYTADSVFTSTTPRPRSNGQRSRTASVRLRTDSRRPSLAVKLANALGVDRGGIHGTLDTALEDSKHATHHDERIWYDQFTSTDFVHDSIADAFRAKELRSRKDIRGRIHALFDGAQGWILVAIIGCITAAVAYFVDVTESAVFDLKMGYCTRSWIRSRKNCCAGTTNCTAWNTWSEVVHHDKVDERMLDFAAYVFFVALLATLSCLLTLTTKTVIPSSVSLATLDENLGADRMSSLDRGQDDVKLSLDETENNAGSLKRPPMIYYPAAGSGVTEVKVILSGFVLHGYLGVKTLAVKTLGLILSAASGLSLGKEGPYVHIASCIGNIACRLFSKYNINDGKRREILSASAASGVTVAFGAPLGGVLFSLEEVSYYFPPKTLFRTFFCCIVAALSLRFLNPYGTDKIVLFEVRYITDWQFFEMIAFVFLGVLGGATGALFIKASRLWAMTFRRLPFVKQRPVSEVVFVALVTGVVSFWNRYTKLPVTELLFELASPCDAFTSSGVTLCPTKENIPAVVRYLSIAFIIKALLTTITFGVKVPAGIYVPSMVVGGLLGRIVGHTVQYLALTHPNSALFGNCPPNASPEQCVTPGVYAMVAAGATMCGVTRLSVTLAVILFELTGSLEHVLPFSIAILVSKWTSDALEPLSIYDLLTDMNSYPYLSNKFRPVFTSELADITQRPRQERIIDVSKSPFVQATELRKKLEYLHTAGELDGGLAIVKDGILSGLIPAPDLEFALDGLEDEGSSLCLMDARLQSRGTSFAQAARDAETESTVPRDTNDFTPYIDPAPVALDVHSPMDLVYECFVKLGLRYICVLRDGRFAGLVHKKAFVGYVKELERVERTKI